MTEAAPETPAETPAEPAEESTFKAPASQADLDRIIADRLAREQRKYADYADLKEKASKLDKLELENASELEKAQKAAEDNAARAQQSTVRAVRAEVKSLADGFADREDAVLNLGDLTRFVDDSGEIDEAAIGKELKAVLDRKPHLAKPEADPKPDPAKAPSRPTERLRPGAAPAADETRAKSLSEAIQKHYQPS